MHAQAYGYNARTHHLLDDSDSACCPAFRLWYLFRRERDNVPLQNLLRERTVLSALSGLPGVGTSKKNFTGALNRRNLEAHLIT